MNKTLSVGPEIDLAENYDKYRPQYQQMAILRLIEFYHRKHPSSVNSKIPLAIDVACGTGQLSGQLADVCDRVIAIDVSPAMLEVAKRHNGHPNIEYRVECAENLNQLCAEEQADIITVGMAIHFFHKENFYSKVRQVMKPGGVFGVFGYITPGLEIKGLETLLVDYFEEQVSNSPFMNTFNSLKCCYKDLHLPFKDIERWASRMLISSNREGLRYLLMSVSYVLRDGLEGIENIVQDTPVERQFEVICDVFGVLAQV